MNRLDSTLVQARENVIRIETKLATAVKILRQLEGSLAETTAALKTGHDPETMRKFNSYSSFYSKLRDNIPRLLDELKSASQRVDELSGLVDARDVWARHMSNVTQDALLVAAQVGRSSGFAPYLADTAMGLVKPTEAVRRELASLDEESLRRFLASNPSEENIERRFLDLPQTRIPLWNALNRCVDLGYERCVRRILASNPPVDVVSEAARTAIQAAIDVPQGTKWTSDMKKRFKMIYLLIQNMQERGRLDTRMQVAVGNLLLRRVYRMNPEDITNFLNVEYDEEEFEPAQRFIVDVMMALLYDSTDDEFVSKKEDMSEVQKRFQVLFAQPFAEDYLAERLISFTDFPTQDDRIEQFFVSSVPRVVALLQERWDEIVFGVFRDHRIALNNPRKMNVMLTFVITHDLASRDTVVRFLDAFHSLQAWDFPSYNTEQVFINFVDDFLRALPESLFSDEDAQVALIQSLARAKSKHARLEATVFERFRAVSSPERYAELERLRSSLSA
jgi:hypothetical protein